MLKLWNLSHQEPFGNNCISIVLIAGRIIFENSGFRESNLNFYSFYLSKSPVGFLEFRRAYPALQKTQHLKQFGKITLSAPVFLMCLKLKLEIKMKNFRSLYHKLGWILSTCIVSAQAYWHFPFIIPCFFWRIETLRCCSQSQVI